MQQKGTLHETSNYSKIINNSHPATKKTTINVICSLNMIIKKYFQLSITNFIHNVHLSPVYYDKQAFHV